MRKATKKQVVKTATVAVVMFGAIACGGTKDGERIESYEQPLLGVSVIQDGDGATAAIAQIGEQCRPPVTFWGACEVVECAGEQACEPEAFEVEIIDEAGASTTLGTQGAASTPLNELDLGGKIEIASSAPDFSTKLSLPTTNVAITAPADGASHDLAGDLAFNWDKGDRGDELVVTFTDAAQCPAVRCRFNARKGSGEVPAEALAALDTEQVQWTAHVERRKEIVADAVDVEVTARLAQQSNGALTLSPAAMDEE